METVTLKAPDISCDHCVLAISEAVGTLEGASVITGNPGAKQVTIEYDPAQVSLSEIEATMAEEGYPVAK